MSDNSNLTTAKNAKNDEFYTDIKDITAEINVHTAFDPDMFRGKTVLCPCDDPAEDGSNFCVFFQESFRRLGLKKLICTSYAKSSGNKQLGLFEENSPQYDADKHETHGRVYIMTEPKDKSDPEYFSGFRDWHYLEGDGDFRSPEVTAFRDEADIIVSNPPFSLFRAFIEWVQPKKRKFAVIGSQNAITYKEIFPLIKDNVIWLGVNKPKNFRQPDSSIKKFGNICWFTNLEHGLRHEKLNYMTMKENLKYNKPLRKKLIEKYGEDPNNLYYPKFDNYDAIECPVCSAIPSDYSETIGVPITFLDSYRPDDFQILGITQRNDDPYKLKRYTTKEYKNANDLNARGTVVVDGTPISIYPRILIRKKA